MANAFINVTVAALDSSFLPITSVTTQRTCIPFQLSSAFTVAVDDVYSFQTLQDEVPGFLIYHW